MTPFLSEEFMLGGEVARALYHEFAADMPIFDFHSHLPVAEISTDRRFQNLTSIWLEGDHYKWRAMRAAGVEERLITGDAGDKEKFLAWAATVPKTLGNPLYVWSHLELKRYFGISGKLLCPGSAEEIYEHCSKLLATEPFGARNLLVRMKVRVLCTTDDPAQELNHHLLLRKDQGFPVRVVPCFRPDKAFAIDSPQVFRPWLERLESASGVQLRDYGSFLEALKARQECFHSVGCRLMDLGLERPYVEPFSQEELDRAFNKGKQGIPLGPREILGYRSGLLLDLARMNWERGWVQQLHLGALRNVNSPAFQRLGPDCGYDAMGDWPLARDLARFLDLLEREGRLPRTVLYVIHPKHHETVAALAGCFQDGSIPGKIQLGPAWWFNDQRQGMESQLSALANMGLLGTFVGMATDSRSFLSFARHEYFRRVLCNFLGAQVEQGELPQDMELLGGMVQDICYNNALSYFQVPIQGQEQERLQHEAE